MREIQFNDVVGKAELGDIVDLQGQKQEVVKCIETGVLMLNIDADQLKTGDLSFIKKLGLTISNPETEKAVALGVEYKTLGRKLADWFESDSDDDDDSGFFSSAVGGAALGGFLGSRSSGGFGGSFGGFGGGSFGGGGASRSF